MTDGLWPVMNTGVTHKLHFLQYAVSCIKPTSEIIFVLTDMFLSVTV